MCSSPRLGFHLRPVGLIKKPPDTNSFARMSEQNFSSGAFHAQVRFLLRFGKPPNHFSKRRH